MRSHHISPPHMVAGVDVCSESGITLNTRSSSSVEHFAALPDALRQHDVSLSPPHRSRTSGTMH
jgi:hypothetical protein